MSEENKTPIYNEGWKLWSQHVRESMEKLETKVEKLDERIIKHREDSLVEISTLKAKAGIMGMIAGFVASTVMSIIIGLLVWHLTTGSLQREKINSHTQPQTSGYILPPKENHSDNISIVMEDIG